MLVIQHQQSVLTRQMVWLHVLTGTVLFQHITAYRRTKFDDSIGQYFCIKCIVNFPEVFRTNIDLYSQEKFCPR